jgi:hypothetical protein
MGSLNLNWKLVSAFATGAVLASGIVYFAVKPQDVVPVAAPMPVQPKPPAVVRTQPAPPPPPVPSVTPPAPVHVAERIQPRPVAREKPSPMPPPVRREPVKREAVTHGSAAVIALNVAPPPVDPKPDPPAPPAAAPATVAPAAPPVETAQVPVQNVSLPAPNAATGNETRVPHTVTLVAGTVLPVRIGEKLSSAHNQVGDIFLATLTQQLVIDGWVIAERGARVEGRVVDITPAGRVKGVSHLGISIVRLATADGQNIRIHTEPYVQDGPTSTGTDAAKIGVGAAIGAIIGAIAGGGKGAGIGAGAGGAAGAGDVLLTRGKPAEIPVETRVSFKVQDSVTITERVD